MKQRLVHLKPILSGIVLTLVVLLFLQATQTSALAGQSQVAAGHFNTVGVNSDGTVVAVGQNDSGQINVSRWTDIVQVATRAIPWG